MKNIALKTKIITGLITGGMLLSSVSTAFAATVMPLNPKQRTLQEMNVDKVIVKDNMA